MSFWLVTIILLLIVAVLFIRKQRNQSKQTTSAALQSKINKYHGVGIRYTGRACEAAWRIRGKRFLSVEVPMLPLADCTMTSCHCRYIHYDDRRDDDRRKPFGKYSGVYPTHTVEDRRKTFGRRDSDLIKLNHI